MCRHLTKSQWNLVENGREQSSEQANSYQLIASACRQANHRQDLAHFVKAAQQQLSSSDVIAGASGSAATTTNAAATNSAGSGSNTNSQSNTISSGIGGNTLGSNNIQMLGNESCQDHENTSNSSSKTHGVVNNIIRYHHFQAPNVQLDELEGSQLDPKSIVSHSKSVLF